MYQTIVLGLGFFLVIGGGYLIKHADQEGVISQSVSADAATRPDYAGTYVCDTDSKCLNPRVLTLGADGTLTMSTSYEGGVETFVENGSWKTLASGIIAEFSSGTTTYEKPYTVRLYAPQSDALITRDSQATYPQWGTPIFRKQFSQSE
jgi:hypothetical protein